MPLQPAPSAQRAVEIVRFLAERPSESLAVAGIARHVGQSRATCQAVLLALEAGDWVHRDASGGYSIGTGLIAVGLAAQRGTAVVDLLRAAVHRLHTETGYEATASIPSGRDLVIVARSGPNEPLAVAMAVGQVFPLVPPYGLAFAAWGEGNLERWLDRAPHLGRSDRARLRKAAAIARHLGYSVILDPITHHALSAETDHLRPDDRREVFEVLAQDEHLAIQSDAPPSAQVSYACAPVLAADDQVVALIGLLLRTRDPQEFTNFSAAVRATAYRVSGALELPKPSVDERSA